MKLTHNTVVFFAAYTRQIDLSLDRAYWASLDELREYYSHQISPRHVADIVDCYTSTEKIPTSSTCQLVVPSSLSLTLSPVKRMLGLNIVSADEWLCFSKKLMQFDDVLTSDVSKYTLEIESLRRWFGGFYFYKLERSINRASQAKTHRVEHFHQNPILKTVPLSFFMDGMNN